MQTLATHSTNDTKARILDAAEQIMLEKGFNGVGLNEILKSVGVPKGSFYHWFSSKEQFGVELIRHYAADSLAYKRQWFAKIETLPNARERIITFLEAGLTHFIEKDCGPVCLIVKLMTEVTPLSQDMRDEQVKYFREVLEIFKTVIKEGQAQGSIKPDLDPMIAAGIINDLWLGSYMRASVCRSGQPGRSTISFIMSYLAP
ncbi:MAG: TetR/AcrR family transcriptional regulator [Akkermansiaceae bacterium]|nr:TetR/AcrR family transcriptional regulator [Akkermansiaceae bacterium]